MEHVLSVSYGELLVSSVEWLNNYMSNCLHLECEIVCDADTKTITVY